MLRKRLAITLFDLASISFLATYAVLAFAPPAYAYVDPSVMTYAIQAFAGVAVALGAVAGVALRRTRKLLFKALHIDENARKDVEPDVHRLDADGRPLDASGELVSTSATRGGVPSKKRAGAREAKSGLRWRGRLACALVVSAFTIFTIFVVAPYEIVASNTTDLIYGLSDIWSIIAFPALLGALVLALALSLLRGKGYQAALLVVFSIGVAAYVQALLLNGALPSADGNAVPWSDYTAIMVGSSFVWLCIIAAPLALSHWFGATCRGAAVVVSACLIIVQGVGVASLFSTAPNVITADPEQSSVVETGERQITEEGLFEVAPRNNVIVLLLDMVDLKYFDSLLETDPSVKDRLDGFTYYSDTAGVMMPTLYSVPYLLSGQLPSPDESISEYVASRYDRSTFLPDISNAGYSIGLYSDSLLLDPASSQKSQEIADSIENYHPLEEDTRSASLNEEGALKVLLKCAMYRDMPWLMKPFFWFYTDEINQGMVNWSVDATGGGVPYTINDFNYYDKLKTIGLSVDDEGQKGAFKFIHLAGAHYPYTMDENVQNIGDNSTPERQTAGVFKIVDEYLDQLRNLGIYDDSTIIIMSDHGWWHQTQKLDYVSCPIMIAKPAASSSYASDGPLRISDVPASHLDFEATVIEAMGLDPSEYGTSLFGLTNESRIRDYYLTLANEELLQYEAIQKVEIDGYAGDLSSWHETDERWSVE